MAAVCLLLAALAATVMAGDRPNLEATVFAEWNALDYHYSSSSRETLYNKDPNFFIPENAMISSLAVYKGTAIVGIPRVKSAAGVPWTLGTVTSSYYSTHSHNKEIKPFPDYDLHTVGDCNEIQNPLAMEVDPNTGYLYVVDTGRVGLLTMVPISSCPAKIVVYDLNHMSSRTGYRILNSYTLPDDVVDRNNSVLSSVVLDYKYPHSDKVRYAYIADSGENQLIVFDFLTQKSWTFSDPSMQEHDKDTVIINGQSYDIGSGLSALALSPDFNYLYWSGMGSDQLYQMPTWPLRTDGNISTAGLVRSMGHKAGNTDDMVHGKDSLYYGALSRDAVFRWEKRHDMLQQNVPEDLVAMNTQTQLVQNWETVQWPDTLCLDERGNLYFTTSRQQTFLTGNMNMNETNFRIFKLPVGEFPYLLDSVPNTPVVG